MAGFLRQLVTHDDYNRRSWRVWHLPKPDGMRVERGGWSFVSSCLYSAKSPRVHKSLGERRSDRKGVEGGVGPSMMMISPCLLLKHIYWVTILHLQLKQAKCGSFYVHAHLGFTGQLWDMKLASWNTHTKIIQQWTGENIRNNCCQLTFKTSKCTSCYLHRSCDSKKCAQDMPLLPPLLNIVAVTKESWSCPCVHGLDALQVQAAGCVIVSPPSQLGSGEAVYSLAFSCYTYGNELPREIANWQWWAHQMYLCTNQQQWDWAFQTVLLLCCEA